jgi:peroxiredoxin Q/BCP
MLDAGDLAPDFAVPDHEGRTVRLSDLRGKRVILWFYPTADTGG